MLPTVSSTVLTRLSRISGLRSRLVSAQQRLGLYTADVHFDLAQVNVHAGNDRRRFRQLRPQRQVRLELLDAHVNLVDLDLANVDEDIGLMRRLARPSAAGYSAGLRPSSATAFRPWRLELLPSALFDPPDVRLLAGITTPSGGTRAAVFPLPPRTQPNAAYATPDHAEDADASKLTRTLRAIG
jgi:hypothetical protein